eukprot:scaffold72376_cov30-Tisochrysis_lutea.AAC.2
MASPKRLLRRGRELTSIRRSGHSFPAVVSTGLARGLGSAGRSDASVMLPSEQMVGFKWWCTARPPFRVEGRRGTPKLPATSEPDGSRRLALSPVVMNEEPSKLLGPRKSPWTNHETPAHSSPSADVSASALEDRSCSMEWRVGQDPSRGD